MIIILKKNLEFLKQKEIFNKLIDDEIFKLSKKVEYDKLVFQ